MYSTISSSVMSLDDLLRLPRRRSSSDPESDLSPPLPSPRLLRLLSRPRRRLLRREEESDAVSDPPSEWPSSDSDEGVRVLRRLREELSRLSIAEEFGDEGD